MSEALVIILQLPLFYLVPWWIVRRDMRRLSPVQLAHCWNDASLGSAILAFGPLCLPVHFIRAHGLLRGSALGVAWMLVGCAIFQGPAWIAASILPNTGR